jgi:hypothetical protein
VSLSWHTEYYTEYCPLMQVESLGPDAHRSTVSRRLWTDAAASVGLGRMSAFERDDGSTICRMDRRR